MKELRINQNQIHYLEQKSEEIIFIHLNYGIDEEGSEELMIITPSECGKKLIVEFR
jgi:hypothetical protein